MLKIILTKKHSNYQKQKEYIIKNVLLKYYNISTYKICYTNNGKPYLVTDQNMYLSISNDQNMLLIVFDNVPVGVDIQFYKPLKVNLNSLLLLNCNNSVDLINIFSAKEAIIKLLGKKLININNINIENYKLKRFQCKDFVINIAYYKKSTIKNYDKIFL